jgi:hypothetical protein
MKYIAAILTTLLFTTLLVSFNTVETKLKDGYYTSSHGHSTVLFRIDGDNVEWYLDNVIKSWGQGKYQIAQTDSVIKVSLTKLKTSGRREFKDEDFDFTIVITWDSDENLFKLKDYQYVDDLDKIDNLKRRVKSSCTVVVERPAR